MAVPVLEPSFSAGELTPALWGRLDLAKMHVGAATLRNCFVDYRGGARSRGGTAYVNRSKQMPQNGDPPPKLVPFSFSISQDYVLEFGNGYVRIIAAGALVTETPIAITAITRANPGQLTVPGHNFANGDWIELAGILGMVELNGNTYIAQSCNTGAGTFTITDLDGVAVDTTAYPGYSSGGTAARIYTIVSPYVNSDYQAIKYVQSADVMTFTHPNYPPYNLSRFGATNWTFAIDNRGPTIGAPQTATASATVQPGSGSPVTLPCAFAYVVTAVDSKTGQESEPSPIANVTDSVDIAATAGSIIITWAPVAGASNYNVYKAPASYNTDPSDGSNALPVPVGALFGIMAQAFGTQFVDSNVTADFAHSPPQFQDPLAPGQILSITMGSQGGLYTHATASITTATGSGFVGTCVIVSEGVAAVVIDNAGQNYAPGDTLVIAGDGSGAAGTLTIGPQTGTWPSMVSYFQQRRVYASSLNQPDTYWMSQPGAFDNFDTSIPVGDADAITGSPWSEKVDGIQWMVEMPLGLITFTGSAIEQVQASGSSVLSPAAITAINQQALPQSSIGSSSTLQPVRENWDILYFEPDNATVRDLTYQLYFNLYTGVDITWQSAHLTLGYQIVDRVWCRKPYYLLWMVRNDGILLSMTFLKDQEVSAWAKHTTQGQVRSVSSATELPSDVLYLCVQRGDTAGDSRYFLERMDTRLWNSVEDAWCVDCAVGTVLTEPNGTLYATATSGSSVEFSCTNNVFSSTDVGSTLRMGGGIAIITSHMDAAHVFGKWIKPCIQTIPDDPSNAAYPAIPGSWSVAPNVTTVSGLGHLVGKNVVGLADGVPIGPLRVLGGNGYGYVTLPFAASDIKLGLGFTTQVQSLYIDGGQPTVQGRRKSLNAVTIRCEASSPMQAGANEIDVSTQYPPPIAATWTNLGSIPASPPQLPATYINPGGQAVQPLFTGDIQITIPSTWVRQGQVAAQQSLPLPLSVLAFVPQGLDGDTPEAGISPRQQQQDQRQPVRRAA